MLSTNESRAHASQQGEDHNGFRAFVRRVVLNERFEKFTTFMVIFNATTIALTTYDGEFTAWTNALGIDVASVLARLDSLALLWFTVELALRVVAHGRAFVHDRWNVFDAALITLSWVGELSFFSALRIFRLLRVLRMMGRFKAMRLITTVMWDSVMGSLAIGMLMLLVMYLFAMIGHQLFGAAYPTLWGNLHTAVNTLFKVMALYAYDDTVKEMADAGMAAHLFLMPYFLLMSFVLLNFFSAIIVYYLYDLSSEELRTGVRRVSAEDDTTAASAQPLPSGGPEVETRDLLEEVRALRKDLAALQSRSQA